MLNYMTLKFHNLPQFLYILSKYSRICRTWTPTITTVPWTSKRPHTLTSFYDKSPLCQHPWIYGYSRMRNFTVIEFHSLSQKNGGCHYMCHIFHLLRNQYECFLNSRKYCFSSIYCRVFSRKRSNVRRLKNRYSVYMENFKY